MPDRAIVATPTGQTCPPHAGKACWQVDFALESGQPFVVWAQTGNQPLSDEAGPPGIVKLSFDLPSAVLGAAVVALQYNGLERAKRQRILPTLPPLPWHTLSLRRPGQPCVTIDTPLANPCRIELVPDPALPEDKLADSQLNFWFP